MWISSIYIVFQLEGKVGGGGGYLIIKSGAKYIFYSLKL